jgi:hypothetical protein
MITAAGGWLMKHHVSRASLKNTTKSYFLISFKYFYFNLHVRCYKICVIKIKNKLFRLDLTKDFIYIFGKIKKEN